MRVRAHDGRHTPVQVPAHRDLLRGCLGVHVEQDVVHPAELPEGDLDLREGRATGFQIEVSAEVHDTQANAVPLDHADPAAGLAAQVIGRAHYAALILEIWVDLAAVVCVVAECDRIDARAEELVGNLRRDAQPAGGVLAVDDDERRAVALAQHGQAVEQGAAAEASDEVPHEQDAHLPGLAGSVPSGARGRRLGLSHTLATMGDR